MPLEFPPEKSPLCLTHQDPAEPAKNLSRHQQRRVVKHHTLSPTDWNALIMVSVFNNTTVEAGRCSTCCFLTCTSDKKVFLEVPLPLLDNRSSPAWKIGSSMTWIRQEKPLEGVEERRRNCPRGKGWRELKNDHRSCLPLKCFIRIYLNGRGVRALAARSRTMEPLRINLTYRKQVQYRQKSLRRYILKCGIRILSVYCVVCVQCKVKHLSDTE